MIDERAFKNWLSVLLQQGGTPDWSEVCTHIRDDYGQIILDRFYDALPVFDRIFQREVNQYQRRAAIFRDEGRGDEQEIIEELIRVKAENRCLKLVGEKEFFDKYAGQEAPGLMERLSEIKEVIGNTPNTGLTMAEARIRTASWPIIVRNQSVLLQVCLPRQDQGDYQTWDVVNGDSTVQLTAGSKPGKDNRLMPGKLPWGKFPRLLLFYINVRVTSHRQQNVWLGESIGQFFDQLGLSRQGYTYDTFYEQLDRLVRCGLTISTRYEETGFPEAEIYPFSKEGSRTTYHHVSSQVDELHGLNRQKGIRIMLSDAFYQSILENPLQISLDSIKELGKNLLAMDLFAMLAERLPRIPEGEEEDISREDLVNLFGSGQEDKGKFFRESFKPALQLMKEKVYPNADFALDKNKLILRPSPPPRSIDGVPDELPPLIE